MAQKRRITYDEFIEERMSQYDTMSAARLLEAVEYMLKSSVWDRDSAAQQLQEHGRELVEDRVEEKPLICKSCKETLYTIIAITNEARVYRVNRDGGTIYLKEEAHLADVSTLVERKCPKCSERVNLSDYDIQTFTNT